MIHKIINTSSIDTSFMTCSKARLSSSCFCLCSAIFSANFLGFAILEMYHRACVVRLAAFHFVTGGLAVNQSTQRKIQVLYVSCCGKCKFLARKYCWSLFWLARIDEFFRSRKMILQWLPGYYHTLGRDKLRRLSLLVSWRFDFPLKLSLRWEIFSSSNSVLNFVTTSQISRQIIGD